MRRHIWVTGANTGIGLETVTQLAERDDTHVTLTCRTRDKVGATIEEVSRRTGVTCSGLAFDLSRPQEITAAIDSQRCSGPVIDGVILNAGSLPGSALRRDLSGFEQTFTDGLLGHHRLVMGLLKHRQFAPKSTIIIAGSESASGLVPLMKPIDLEELASRHFECETEAVSESAIELAIESAIESVIRADTLHPLSRGTRYASAKLFAAWWSAALSRRLPLGSRVFTVSPGNTYHTEIARHQPQLGRLLHVGLTPIIGRLSRQAGSTRQAAARYLEALTFPYAESGRFYASPPGRGIGPLQPQTMTHITHVAHQECCWRIICKLTETTTEIAE